MTGRSGPGRDPGRTRSRTAHRPGAVPVTADIHPTGSLVLPSP
jgi:hypothetical protein